jgi:hypothetical protein
MNDPFKGLTVRQTAALGLAAEYRKAAMRAKRNYENKRDESIMAMMVARKEGVGIKRLAHVWGVAPSFISKMIREAGEKTDVLPTHQHYSQNGGNSSADDPALEGVGAVQRQEHLDQLTPGEVDVPRGVFLPPDSDP